MPKEGLSSQERLMLAAFGIGMGALGLGDTARRLYDLLFAMRDFGVDFEALDLENRQGQRWTRLVFSGCHHFDLRLCSLERGKGFQYGFELIEPKAFFHSPALCVRRGLHRPVWTGVAFNQDSASPGMANLLRDFGLQSPGERVDFSDRAANILFGGCCRLYHNGTL